ncbi:MAG: hypothetical protein V3T33_10015 [Myxococcota bacterium]
MKGPPPLAPFGLELHHDGSWSHEGQPIRNRKLRQAFDRSVRYLPGEGKFVVQLGRFRAEIEVEEAAFFVRSVDPEAGTIRLSDGGDELLEVPTLHRSSRDGAWLCRVKRGLLAEGLVARFSHAAHAELLAGVEQEDSGPVLHLAGQRYELGGLPL